MKLLIVVLTGNVYWRIGQNDPLRFSSRTFKDWYLINPLAYLSINSHLPADERDLTARCGHLIGDSALVEANGLMFEVPNEFDMGDANADHIGELINQFMVRLRSISHQVHLSGVSEMIMGLHEIDEYPEVLFPEAVGVGGVRHHIVDTAITIAEMEEADRQSVEYTPPVFHTLILDGIQALQEKNYRTAILYAAMSIETISAAKLDAAYCAAISDSNNPKYRMINQTNENGKVEKKDPVYKQLSNRTEFRTLLHEQPLYLLERSLLIDDKPLYDRAIRLYKTRNKVVHRGELPEDQNEYFDIGEAGARTAIECAIHIFHWFGECGKYSLPNHSFLQTYSTYIE